MATTYRLPLARDGCETTPAIGGVESNVMPSLDAEVQSWAPLQALTRQKYV